MKRDERRRSTSPWPHGIGSQINGGKRGRRLRKGREVEARVERFGGQTRCTTATSQAPLGKGMRGGGAEGRAAKGNGGGGGRGTGSGAQRTTQVIKDTAQRLGVGVSKGKRMRRSEGDRTAEGRGIETAGEARAGGMR